MTSDSMNECWRRRGVWGSRSCDELATHGHCHNCPEFASGASALLNREAPTGYLEEWTDFLAREKEMEAPSDGVLGVFRIAQEWLALPARLLSEIVAVRDVRRIPHRANGILLGMVSVRGAVNLCFSLGRLLRLDDNGGPTSVPRFVVVKRNRDYWVFPVDEFSGLLRYREINVEPVPANVGKAVPSFSRGVLTENGRKIGLLNEDLVFETLERAIR